ADRARIPPQPAGDLSHPLPGMDQGCDLLAFRPRQVPANRPRQLALDSPRQPRERCVCPTSPTCRPRPLPPPPTDRCGSRPEPSIELARLLRTTSHCNSSRSRVLRHYLELATRFTTISRNSTPNSSGTSDLHVERGEDLQG